VSVRELVRTEMQCEVYDRLEAKLVKFRAQSVQRAMSAEPSEDDALRDAAEEQRLIDELTDHRAEHGCKKAGD